MRPDITWTANLTLIVMVSRSKYTHTSCHSNVELMLKIMFAVSNQKIARMMFGKVDKILIFFQGIPILAAWPPPPSFWRIVDSICISSATGMGLFLCISLSLLLPKHQSPHSMKPLKYSVVIFWATAHQRSTTLNPWQRILPSRDKKYSRQVCMCWLVNQTFINNAIQKFVR